MAQQLKRWESPRSQGRNIKGKGGSARARQLKKQRQALRNKLNQTQNDGKDKKTPSLFFYGVLINNLLGYWGKSLYRFEQRREDLANGSVIVVTRFLRSLKP
jgi:hypothetical protein